MMWFETLIGFPEESPQQVRKHITVDGTAFKSHVNGKTLVCGQLETPSLGELRARVHSSGHRVGQISVREVVANVQHLHTNELNSGSLFQVASQFNLLEMTSPNVTPEEGVGIYENDPTQGPACAVAAGAGTVYRNYFAIVNGQIGQSAGNQIDCLADIGVALGNCDSRLWEMRNGYALVSQSGLTEISNRLRSSSESELDELRKLLRIGIQWNTQVTLNNSQHTVSQAYCSALPVAYCRHSSTLWAEFARLVLEASYAAIPNSKRVYAISADQGSSCMLDLNEGYRVPASKNSEFGIAASYEATICTAILNSVRNGDNKLFLTLLGGSVFGNETDWIIGGIQRALNLYKHVALDIAIVSYGLSKPYVQSLIHQLSK